MLRYIVYFMFYFRCKYCREFAPVWNELAKKVIEQGIMVKIAKVRFASFALKMLECNAGYCLIPLLKVRITLQLRENVHLRMGNKPLLQLNKDANLAREV